MQPTIYVHAGAGNDYDDQVAAFRQAAQIAARIGWERLNSGGRALDAVEAAVVSLEDAPVSDAGGCSYPNADGVIEMDAMVMRGRDLGYGAVAALARVANPVRVARLVLEQSPHCLIVGSGAERFARSHGVPVWQPDAAASTDPSPFDPLNHPGDTVGAIARDAEGNLAVAVSTGGTRGKLPGRVGDSPIIGCGGYADNDLGAAAATGHGEALMRILISKTACDEMARGLSPQAAAEAVLARLQAKTGPSQGGIIVMNPRGEVGAAFNTHHFARAFIGPDGVAWVAD